MIKSQMEIYKKEIKELHDLMLNEELKRKKLEYEYKSLEESCANLRAAKEKVQAEHELLKEAHEQLQSRATLFQSDKQSKCCALFESNY